jgi:hypothetical protein
MHYNRKERKNLAKQLGLAKDETSAQREERVSRSIMAGRQISQQFQMQVENAIRNQMTEKEAQMLKSLTETHGEAEAERIIANNRMVEEKRQAKLLKKKNR